MYTGRSVNELTLLCCCFVESGPIILPPPKSAPTETYRAIQSASHFKVAIKLVRQQDMTDEVRGAHINSDHARSG